MARYKFWLDYYVIKTNLLLVGSIKTQLNYCPSVFWRLNGDTHGIETELMSKTYMARN